MNPLRYDGPVFVIGIADGAGDRLADRLGSDPGLCRIPRTLLLSDLTIAVDRNQPALAVYGMPQPYWRKALAVFFNGLLQDHAARNHKARWAAFVSSSSLSIADLDELFPTAQFVHVVTRPRGGAGRIISANRRTGAQLRPGRFLELDENEMMADMDGSAHQVLRFLGEEGLAAVEAEVVVDLTELA
jgi:hypothetical protein